LPKHPEKSADALRPLSWPQLAAVVLPIILAVLYGIWAKHNYQNYYGKLDSFGVDTEATIIAKYTGTRGNVGSRSYYEIRFEFTVGDKTRRGSVRVTRGFYNSYSPPDRVLVRHLPDNLQIRELDPGMRRKSLRNTYTIIAILLFIGLANIFVIRGERRGQRRVKENK
jgi:hypothetical protein